LNGFNFIKHCPDNSMPVTNSSLAPSPVGEGWGEENKNNRLYPPFSLKGEGVGTRVNTYVPYRLKSYC